MGYWFDYVRLNLSILPSPSDLLLPTHFRCRYYWCILSYAVKHTHTHTHKLGTTPLDEWTVRHRDLYWRNTARTTDKHPWPCGIRTRSPSKRASADPRLRLHGHRNRQEYICEWELRICRTFFMNLQYVHIFHQYVWCFLINELCSRCVVRKTNTNYNVNTL